METMDDAGIFRINDEEALVQTVDFFTPVVADPCTFGRIVAANSLSDVWAMGGKPLTAMNILCFSSDNIPTDAIEELLTGASEKLVESSVVLVGGHTMEQDEFVYGMSITGIIHPDKALRNSMARTGDLLILTKPLGSGILSTANKAGRVSEDVFSPVIASMERLNMYAADVFSRFDTSALTDITGFGLFGHALAMARTAGVRLSFNVDQIPFFDDAVNFTFGYVPKGSQMNREYAEPFTTIDSGLDERQITVLFDAQTSGGLLGAVRADSVEAVLAAIHSAGDTAASIVGEVTELLPETGREDGLRTYLSVHS